MQTSRYQSSIIIFQTNFTQGWSLLPVIYFSITIFEIEKMKLYNFQKNSLEAQNSWNCQIENCTPIVLCMIIFENYETLMQNLEGVEMWMSKSSLFTQFDAIAACSYHAIWLHEAENNPVMKTEQDKQRVVLLKKSPIEYYAR